MITLLRKLYGYQSWANSELFDELESLDQEQHEAELHTALRLINHVHVVTRIFAAHLTGAQHCYTSDNTDETPGLSALRAAVASSDQWYLDYVRDCPVKDLTEAIPIVFTDTAKGYMTREEMLTHVVLHGGYHRGEVGRILRQASATVPWDTFAVHLHQIDPTRRQQGGKQQSARRAE